MCGSDFQGFLQLENHPVSKPGACSVNRQNKRKYEELEERSESSGAEKTSPSLVDSDDSEASLKECNRDLNNGLDKTWSVKLQVCSTQFYYNIFV